MHLLSLDQPIKGVVKSPLWRCFEYRWLHNEVITPSQVVYMFASPLHKQYVQCMPLGNLEKGAISKNCIEDIIITVICKSIPLNLSGPCVFGVTTQFTPEAQFQEEFYCACMSHTKDCMLSFPEFGKKTR
jgi:hypothetical protein